ncbi:MAG: response regulator [Pirellulaceae bacterium]|nr:response regulator [Pirellulaceae bacterium]
MSNILLVEDSPTQALQLKLLLESGSHKVEVCDDGVPALQLLADGVCELVISDLELPVMNGLELIRRMKSEFPDVPAVLITGQGSERLAAEALSVGATAYVPKSMANDLLLSTVEDVLGVMRTDQRYSELIDCTLENRMVFLLPNQPEHLIAAIDLVTQMAAGMELLTVMDRYRVSQALQQAASNAMFRGNLELSRQQCPQASISDCRIDSLPSVVRERLNAAPYRNRKIHFDARLMRDLIRIVIKDDGHGFDVKTWESRHQVHEGAAPFTGDTGRGFALIYRFMDKVSFNGSGNEITLVKHCLASKQS